MAINETAGTFDEIEDMDSIFNSTNASTGINSWIYFRSPSTSSLVSNLIVSILGLGGNCLVFALLRDVKFSLLSYPIYLRFLAVSDSSVLIIYGVHKSLRYFHMFHVIGNHDSVCGLWMFMRRTVTVLSPWLVVGLTVDRFYCVVFPLKRDRVCTRRKATIVCSCLAALSGVLTLPLVLDVKTVKGLNTQCYVKDQYMAYYYFVRLVLTSILPCLLILIFNIVIGMHIQRSATFQKRFTSSTNSANTETKLDKSLRPLMLISILAFVTIVPLAITDCILAIQLITKSGFETIVILVKLWPMFNILYLINFGQNLYILMASSANYRKIMKDKLTCRDRKSSRQRNKVRVSRFPWHVSEPTNFGTDESEFSTRLSAATSITSDNAPAKDSEDRSKHVKAKTN
ncbi:somatostatin receptor type 5-like [Gigantopelta aegis]|uniref:somatostatin receptor type 5-like n=1 Tax=Gigantopelta aegis TaxID=1735272 RepID=UPI001B88D466|nr:somatostatin receptor type 5-like [Gigantopelta aegis]